MTRDLVSFVAATLGSASEHRDVDAVIHPAARGGNEYGHTVVASARVRAGADPLERAELAERMMERAQRWCDAVGRPMYFVLFVGGADRTERLFLRPTEQPWWGSA